MILLPLLVNMGCGAAERSRERRLIRAEDGRSTLAKQSPSVGSGARRMPLVPADSGDVPSIQRYLVDRIVRAGPGRLLQLVPLAPVFDAQRRFRGFRIERVYDNSPRVLRYGVRPGDELISVNGVRILRPSHMLILFKRLANATELDIVVRRGGAMVRHRVPIVDVDTAPPSTSASHGARQ